MNTRQPTSKLEKLFEGLRIIKQFQPAAPLAPCTNGLYVGDITDKHITAGAREYLKGLGFLEDEERAMFVFNFRGNAKQVP